jgi:hypothetical protein
MQIAKGSAPGHSERNMHEIRSGPSVLQKRYWRNSTRQHPLAQRNNHRDWRQLEQTEYRQPEDAIFLASYEILA